MPLIFHQPFDEDVERLISWAFRQTKAFSFWYARHANLGGLPQCGNPTFANQEAPSARRWREVTGAYTASDSLIIPPTDNALLR